MQGLFGAPRFAGRFGGGAKGMKRVRYPKVGDVWFACAPRVAELVECTTFGQKYVQLYDGYGDTHLKNWEWWREHYRAGNLTFIGKV